jgi:hypothetical protein
VLDFSSRKSFLLVPIRIGYAGSVKWVAPAEKDKDTNTLEKRFWEAADQLRANSGLNPQEYSGSVLGLIFLRFAEVRFAKLRGSFAGIAQLVEQLICNQQVVGSNPTAGSPYEHWRNALAGERICVTDCVTHFREPNRTLRSARNHQGFQAISGLSEPTCGVPF